MLAKKSTRLIAGTLNDMLQQMEPVRKTLPCAVPDHAATTETRHLDPIPEHVIDAVVDRMLKELTW